MLIKCNEEKLRRTLLDFSNATGLNINFVDNKFLHADLYKIPHNEYCKEIQSTEKGRKLCFSSDCELLGKCKKSGHIEMHICHAGLLDVAVPIFHNDILLGYIIFGQMKTEPDFSEAEKNIKELISDTDATRVRYNALPLYSGTQVESIANIAVILVKYVLLENMLNLNLDKNTETALSFIEENLDKHMTIQYISKSTNISKTALYNLFRSNFNCTVSEYINQRRIEKSISLLLETNLSIEEISQSVGVSSAAYYSLLFKKHKNISPLKFKKLHLHKALLKRKEK